MGIVLLIAITNKIMESQGSTGSFLGIAFPMDTDYIAIPSVLFSLSALFIVSLLTPPSPESVWKPFIEEEA